MTEVRFKQNIAGFLELRYSEPTRRILEAVAHTIADICNDQLTIENPTDLKPGYEIRSQAGKKVKQGRWRVSVTAWTPHAIRHNAIHNTLLRALGGGKA